MKRTLVPVLRFAAALVALAALVLSSLHLGSLVTAWMGDSGAGVGTVPHLIPSRILIVLPWGVGFATLALVIIWRVGHKEEALVAALFLAFYSLWTGIGRNPLFEGETWLRPVLYVIDGLSHAIGIRFTQVFPRPLTAGEVARFGRGWFRQTVSPILATLTRSRFFWPFAVVLEVLGRVTGMSGLFYAHVITWLILGSAYLYIAYRLGTREDRRRVFWILEGVLVFLALELVWVSMWSIHSLGVVSLDLAFWGRWQSVAEAWITLICFALAIFYSGAFDSGLILRRTTVLSASGALVVIIFVALETTLGELVEDVLGPDTRAGDIAIGVMAALAFRPLSERLDRRVLKWTSRAESRVLPLDEPG